MKKKLIIIVLSFFAALTLGFGISACSNGDSNISGNCKSAYDIYREAYIKANGSAENILSEEQWLESLQGEQGNSVENVEIVCGDMTVYFSDGTHKTLEKVFPEAGHSWDSGVITTEPTCITLGVKTHICKECDVTKTVIIDAEENAHCLGEYEHDEQYHWQSCKICGETKKSEHDFGGVDKVNVDEVLECRCGISTTVGALYSYKIDFEIVGGASVRVFETQDYTLDGIISLTAYSRSKSGELLKDGEGQVNFEVIPNLGYKVGNITVTPSSGYKNLKGEEETLRANTYRITKITSDITVHIEMEIDTLELPVMVINTLNSVPILDKENYVNCNVSVFNADEDYCFMRISADIRGRGNSSWTMPKKPYKLKFDAKVDLFGNGSAKTWTLIANYNDPSLIRNYLAYSSGAVFESIKETTTKVQFVELYLNDEYEGVYLICEQNEVGSTRVDIEDDFIVVNDPSEMGYLLELDARAPLEGQDNLDYFIVNDNYYAIKSPDYKDAFDGINYDEYFNYIKNYVNEAMEAFSTNNYYSVLKYIDVETFAESYIIHELFKMCDVGYSSFYIYKKSNDKLYCGPIWDFDISSGNCDYNNSRFYDVIWAGKENIWYSNLLKYDEFKLLISEKLNYYRTFIKNSISNSAESVLNNSNSFLRNFERWNTLGTYIWPNPEEIVAITVWQEQVEYVVKWLDKSLAFLISYYVD